MTTATLPVIACTRCTTVLTITDDMVARAERAHPIAVDADHHRSYLAAIAAVGSGWEHHANDLGRPFCKACIPAVEHERAAALGCPAWCEDCQGYNLDAASITHCKEWTGPDGYRIALLVQVVGDEDGDGDADPPWIELTKQDVTAADLLALQTAVPAMLAFLATHGLHGFGEVSA